MLCCAQDHAAEYEDSYDGDNLAGNEEGMAMVDSEQDRETSEDDETAEENEGGNKSESSDDEEDQVAGESYCNEQEREASEDDETVKENNAGKEGTVQEERGAAFKEVQGSTSFRRPCSICAKARMPKYRGRIKKIKGSLCGSHSTIADCREHPAILALVRIDEMPALSGHSIDDFFVDVGCTFFRALGLPDCQLPPWFKSLYKLWMGVGPYREATHAQLNDVVHTIQARLAHQPRMQCSDAFNKMLRLFGDCNRLKFRSLISPVFGDEQQQVADLLQRVDEEREGCCAAMVRVFLLAFPGLYSHCMPVIFRSC